MPVGLRDPQAYLQQYVRAQIPAAASDYEYGILRNAALARSAGRSSRTRRLIV